METMQYAVIFIFIAIERREREENSSHRLNLKPP